MISQPNGRLAAAVTLALAIGLTGCAQHVTQDQLDEAVSDVRAQVDDQSQRIDQNEEAIQNLRQGQKQLEKALQKLRQDVDARIKKLEDRLALSLPVHFEFDQAEIRPVDEPILNRFAATVSQQMPNGVVTVEGFADAAGSDAYNRELAQERAQAVRDYLVQEAGLSANRVRAVSYGENRLINEQTGPGRSGIENRRVTFVIEFSGEVGG